MWVYNTDDLWASMCLYYFKIIKFNSPIRMDEICTHWKILCFDDYESTTEGSSNITITTELEVIVDHFSNAYDATKLYDKEQLRKVAFSETTNLKPPSQLVKTKGAPKKVKTSQDDSTTKRTSSYHEVVGELFSNSPIPKSKTSFKKGARISKPPRTPTLTHHHHQ